METIQVTIKTEHYRRSDGFVNPYGCPLAQALSDIKPGSNIQVGGTYLRINGKRYTFDAVLWGGDNGISAREIERRCNTTDEEFEPVVLTLTEFCPSRAHARDVNSIL
jgi:hypothetical protein